jgi:hypothetical protein
MVEVIFMNLLRIEKRAQRFCAVTIIGRSLRLEIVNPDFLSGVQIPTWLGKDGRHMAGGALRLVDKDSPGLV